MGRKNDDDGVGMWMRVWCGGDEPKLKTKTTPLLHSPAGHYCLSRSPPLFIHTCSYIYLLVPIFFLIL